MKTWKSAPQPDGDGHLANRIVKNLLSPFVPTRDWACMERLFEYLVSSAILSMSKVALRMYLYPLQERLNSKCQASQR